MMHIRFIDFFKRRSPDFSYNKFEPAGEMIRDSFLRDLFMYELPVALGPAVVSLLIQTVESTEDRILISGCIANLQAITGVTNGHRLRYTPDMSPKEARRTLGIWRQWYQRNYIDNADGN